MTAPVEDSLPDVGTVDEAEPVVLEDAGEPDDAYLRGAVAHVKGRDADASGDDPADDGAVL